MDRSVLDRAPLTGIPGSMQEYVSNVTTAEMQKYTEFFFLLLLFCTTFGMEICCVSHRILCKKMVWKLHSGGRFRSALCLSAQQSENGC